ncbi:hypothetical protein SAMN05421856_11447 [Chryseobacterium taichungense]|uniref:MORN repeat variant n=1 Tax=Chryseobacterium taichungense TaxID=295069 RepID=A0A1H8DMK6_9FLAO|nr:hypothetical protein [Chryseobacterium taichungense]SEN08385.1 hypothetical protein SAMN05421856_11447 [Chryseobacterium taichungense]
MQKLSFLLIFLVLVSCKTKINQYVKDEKKVSKRDGKWKEEYSADEGILHATGKYRMGEKVGVWKMNLNGRKYQKDVIRKGITRTKRYFPNGKIMEKGQSKIDISENERHWFYYGPWEYYNDTGKLLYIKIYNQGQKTDSISKDH